MLVNVTPPVTFAHWQYLLNWYYFAKRYILGKVCQSLPRWYHVVHQFYSVQHYVYNHWADLTLQGTVCPTGYASIHQNGVICQYFQNSGNFHHLGVLFTIWQIHLLCYIIIMQHHSWDEFTYWQCTPCHIRLCQCVYQNDEYYVNYSKYKAWYAFLKQSVDSRHAWISCFWRICARVRPPGLPPMMAIWLVGLARLSYLISLINVYAE